MNEDQRIGIAKILDQINDQMNAMDQAQNTVQEGELLSGGNKTLARMLEGLGVEVAKVEALQTAANDNYDYLRHKTALEFMQKNAIEKSKSLARIDEKVVETLRQLRSLESSLTILKIKTKSFWAYLDNSRSRLSWLGKDRSSQ